MTAGPIIAAIILLAPVAGVVWAFVEFGIWIGKNWKLCF